LGADGDGAVAGAHICADLFEPFYEVNFELFAEVVFQSFFESCLIIGCVNNYFLGFFGNVGAFELVDFDVNNFGFAKNVDDCSFSDLFFLNYFLGLFQMSCDPEFLLDNKVFDGIERCAFGGTDNQAFFGVHVQTDKA